MEGYSLKDKKKGMEQVRECTILSSSSSFFLLSVFIFFSFPPFFSFHVEIEVLLFPFVLRYSSSSIFPSSYSHPRMNEERTITFCFRLEDFLFPRAFGFSSVFCLHFNRPSATRTFWPAPTTLSLVSFHLHAPG